MSRQCCGNAGIPIGGHGDLRYLLGATQPTDVRVRTARVSHSLSCDSRYGLTRVCRPTDLGIVRDYPMGVQAGDRPSRSATVASQINATLCKQTFICIFFSLPNFSRRCLQLHSTVAGLFICLFICSRVLLTRRIRTCEANSWRRCRQSLLSPPPTARDAAEWYHQHVFADNYEKYSFFCF